MLNARNIRIILSFVVVNFLTISILSYSQNDPSYFHYISDDKISNICRKPGSYISSLFIETLGYLNIILILFLYNFVYLDIKKTRFLFYRFAAGTACIFIWGMVLFAYFGKYNEKIVGIYGYMFYPKMQDIPYSEIIFFNLFILNFFLTLFAFKINLFSLFKWLVRKNSKISYDNLSIDDSVEPQKKLKIFANKQVKEKSLNIEQCDKNITNKKTKKSSNQSQFVLPSEALLQDPTGKKIMRAESDIEHDIERLNKVLKDFGISGDICSVKPGPVVTLYELEPAAGVKSSRIIGLADDIARSMRALSTRIANIPGHNLIGIEIPNVQRETIYFKELVTASQFAHTDAKLPLALGKNIAGEPIIIDLCKTPHLLVAGTTGSGKSVSVNSMIASLLYKLTPQECRFIMIDPKMLELSVYDGIPHLLSPVVTDPKKAVVALKWVVKEMEERYRIMSNMSVRNINGYNEKIQRAIAENINLSRTVKTGFDSETGKPILEEQEIKLEKLPFIVVIVDEMADLMLVAGKDIEASIQRLAQMARAAGIHIIMATQRPSVDVITGVIKANFPSRISFQVTSRIDSRTILGEQGAEQLLGMGDMLYMSGGGKISRVHAPFLSDKEVEEIVTMLKENNPPEYSEDIANFVEENSENGGGSLMSGQSGDEGGNSDDILYKKAVEIVLRDKKTSISYVQRVLRIGYNRAALCIERMEKEGILSGPSHTGKREILEERE